MVGVILRVITSAAVFGAGIRSHKLSASLAYEPDAKQQNISKQKNLIILTCIWYNKLFYQSNG
jgi:hypothetical protein